MDFPKNLGCNGRAGAHKHWKVANGGATTWRPAVHTLRMSRSSDCSNPVTVTSGMVSLSGISSVAPCPSACGADKMLDSSTSTSWRPQCHECAKGAAWLKVSFSTNVGIPDFRSGVDTSRRW